ncbi:hypothetical protein OGZ37_09480 [Lactococcus lactis]|uniref:hypothetical protein n=1 Tax=Lactococcus lactis TaxID=1358 RepID=UPI0024188550|nr:hypothetical protein [Lactococcus lactis]MDG4966801.1 hypothetical protein [Lactococcus lactis]
MKNIIRACPYVAGIDSIGMRSLKAYHTELTDKQIEKLDPLNANNGLPAWYILPMRTDKTSKKPKKR